DDAAPVPGAGQATGRLAAERAGSPGLDRHLRLHGPAGSLSGAAGRLSRGRRDTGARTARRAPASGDVDESGRSAGGGGGPEDVGPHERCGYRPAATAPRAAPGVEASLAFA